MVLEFSIHCNIAMFSSPLNNIDTSVSLPAETNSDGKSLRNLDPGSYRSGTYDHFPTPIDEHNNAFDFHS